MKYVPLVRGKCELDVSFSKVEEVQRITFKAQAESQLTDDSTFALTWINNDGITSITSDIAFCASAIEVKNKIEELVGISSVIVDNIRSNSHESVWEVTFVSNDGDVELLTPVDNLSRSDLGLVIVEEIIKGKLVQSITGFPRIIDVAPGITEPVLTKAFGRGLEFATAGKIASFEIQAKGGYGNNRMENQEKDVFKVILYPELDKTEEYATSEGMIAYESDGKYKVNFIASKSGYHTIAYSNHEESRGSKDFNIL